MPPPTSLRTPPTSYMRLTRADWARSISQWSIFFSHTAQTPHRFVQFFPPPFLSDRVGVWQSRSIVKDTLSAPVLGDHSGAYTIPSMTRQRVASWLDALTMGYRFASPTSRLCSLIEFHNASTKPHIPYGRLHFGMTQEFLNIFSRINPWMDYHLIV